MAEIWLSRRQNTISVSTFRLFLRTDQVAGSTSPAFQRSAPYSISAGQIRFLEYLMGKWFIIGQCSTMGDMSRFDHYCFNATVPDFQKKNRIRWSLNSGSVVKGIKKKRLVSLLLYLCHRVIWTGGRPELMFPFLFESVSVIRKYLKLAPICPFKYGNRAKYESNFLCTQTEQLVQQIWAPSAHWPLQRRW